MNPPDSTAGPPAPATFRPWVWMALAAVFFGCGQSPEVETISAHRGTIHESFAEPAKTRLEKTYRITMPVDGRIGRIDQEPGDRIEEGQVLAQYDLEPFEHAVREAAAKVEELKAQIRVKEDHRLEQTALANTLTLVDAASESLKAMEAQVEAQRVRADRAEKELERIQSLASQEAATQRTLDDAVAEAETAMIDLRRQEFYRAALRAVNVAVNLGPSFVRQYIARKELEREVLVHQLAQAQAKQDDAQHQLELASIRSPIDGVVLERMQQGDSMLPAGEPLLLLGDLDLLEVEAEILTQDALLLHPGSRVQLEPAARLEPLIGEVKRVEPAGFTKLSSLGVEQQRVLVIVSLNDTKQGLGVGYRLQAEFFIDSKDNALIVPRHSVLQAPDESYYVLEVQDGTLRRREIELGLRSDLELEVLAGLDETTKIVAHPDTSLEVGMEVEITSESGE